MAYRIEKEFHFSASHQLRDLPEDHQCARLHGHNYILKVILFAKELTGPGFVVDYGELKFIKDQVDKMDHRHLNDLFPFNPTSENVCRYFCELQVIDIKAQGWDNVIHVSIALSETPKTWAYYDMRVDSDEGE